MLTSPYLNTFPVHPQGTDVSPQIAKPGGNSYKCRTCSKAFKRSEHCARHELAHTKERPFSCQFCAKSFARKDLVKRHERTLHAEKYDRAASALGEVRDNGERNTTSISETSDLGSGLVETNIRDFGAQDCITVDPSPTRSNQNQLQGNSTPTQLTQKLPRGRRATFSGRTMASIRASHSISPSPSAISAPQNGLHGSQTGTALNSNPSLPQEPDNLPVEHSAALTFDFESMMSVEQIHTQANEQSTMSPISRATARSSSESRRAKRPCISSDGNVLVQPRPGDLIGSPAPQHSPLADPCGLLGPFEFLIDDFLGPVADDFFCPQLMHQQVSTSETGLSTLDAQETLERTPSSFTESVNASSPGCPKNSSTDNSHSRSRRLSARLPVILKETSVDPPRLDIDEQGYQRICSDSRHRLGPDDHALPIRNRKELQHLLNGYLDCFYRHLPIIHLPSLVLSDTPSPLVYAMCCIGALYRLERRKARKIYATADLMLNLQTDRRLSFSSVSAEDHDAREGSDPQPLWLMQSRVLLSIYATLGADTEIAISGYDRLGSFIKEYRLRRSLLERKSELGSTSSWQDWVERESSKRLLCGFFIYSDLLVLLYDIPPGFDIMQDLEVEVLDEERLWNASTSKEWEVLRQSRSTGPSRTIRSVLVDMLSGATDDGSAAATTCFISGFTTLVLLHAVNIHLWHLVKFSQSLNQSFSDVAGCTPSALLSTTLTTLTRCRDILHHSRLDTVESPWNNPEGPLLFCCETILRVAYTRLFTDINMPQRLLLLHNSTEDKARALKAFVAGRQERSPLITKAVARAAEAFSLPSKAGYLLVRKTAAFSWSVEHAVAGWGCVILLSKWIHHIQVQSLRSSLTEAELAVISQVESALEHMDSNYDAQNQNQAQSLAAAVASAWVPLLNDVRQAIPYLGRQVLPSVSTPPGETKFRNFALKAKLSFSLRFRLN